MECSGSSGAINISQEPTVQKRTLEEKVDEIRSLVGALHTKAFAGNYCPHCGFKLKRITNSVREGK